MEAAAEAFAEAAEDDPGMQVDADTAAAAVEADLDAAGLAKERDEYLDALRRLQADFENYKKRMVRQQTEHLERAAEHLVTKLLPVFDTVDLAIAHGGGEEVQQVWSTLFDTLEKEGLERIDPMGQPFDPNQHEAVMHEPGDGDGEPEVIDVMRAGYRWKGRVLRPAMVKVKG
jgi:molecular chaperone GrpE